MAQATVHVAMCIDRGFAVPLAVALASLDQVSSADSVVVHVLHPGLPEDVKSRIVSGLSSLEVHWLLVDQSTLTGAHFTEGLSAASLFRLMLADLLPENVDRVIYLDADILVLSSIAPLYAADLRGQVVGAVRDAGCLWAAGPLGMPWRELGVDPSSPYFNSGVLVVDRALWASESVGIRTVDLLRSRRLRWGDQDGLNVVLDGRWQETHRRWNLQTVDLTGYTSSWALARQELEEALAAPGVVHFTGVDKPWHFGSTHPMTDDWLAFLDRTAWSGWRPPEPKEGKTLKAARSVARAGRNLRVRRRPGLPS